jgi:hypothetical protein
MISGVQLDLARGGSELTLGRNHRSQQRKQTGDPVILPYVGAAEPVKTFTAFMWNPNIHDHVEKAPIRHRSSARTKVSPVQDLPLYLHIYNLVFRLCQGLNTLLSLSFSVARSLCRREEHNLWVFENRVLRRIFRPKKDGVTGGWRKLHNEELHDLYSSPSIISRGG